VGSSVLVQKNTPAPSAYLRPKKCLEDESLGFPLRTLDVGSQESGELIFVRTFLFDARLKDRFKSKLLDLTFE
jgi:hypothetical protein